MLCDALDARRAAFKATVDAILSQKRPRDTDWVDWFVRLDTEYDHNSRASKQLFNNLSQQVHCVPRGTSLFQFFEHNDDLGEFDHRMCLLAIHEECLRCVDTERFKQVRVNAR